MKKLLPFLAVLVLVACSGDPNVKPDVAGAANYAVLQSSSRELVGKTIAERYIKILPDPLAAGPVKRTAIAKAVAKAAFRLQGDTGCDIAIAWVVPSRAQIGSGALAKATFVPSGENLERKKCPVWDVWAANADIPAQDFEAMARGEVIGRYLETSGYPIELATE